MSRRRNRFEMDLPCLERRVAEVECRLRVYFRLWLHGPGSRGRVWNEIALTLGPGDGREALKALEGYWAALGFRTGREVCACGAADIIALIVSRAALGDRRTAARLCRHVAPRGRVEHILASAEAVANAFLGREAQAGSGEPASATALRRDAARLRSAPAAEPVDGRITHDYQSETLRH